MNAKHALEAAAAVEMLEELAVLEFFGLLEVERGDDGSVRCRPTPAGVEALAGESEDASS